MFNMLPYIHGILFCHLSSCSVHDLCSCGVPTMPQMTSLCAWTNPWMICSWTTWIFTLCISLLASRLDINTHKSVTELKFYFPFITPTSLIPLVFGLDWSCVTKCVSVYEMRNETSSVFNLLHFPLENRWWAFPEEGWKDSDLWHRLRRCMEGKSTFTLSVCLCTCVFPPAFNMQ